MSAATSPSAGRCYGVRRVCETWQISRSTFYDWRQRRSSTRSLGKRGPKTEFSDSELADEIRVVLADSEQVHGFRGEGHRKAWARLRFRGMRTSQRRVLRIMREQGLLAAHRPGTPRGPRVHNGRIITDRPDEMWGTDATQIWTLEDGYVWVFAAIDHCTGEIVGTHASTKGNRFEALIPVQDGVREYFGGLESKIAEGLSVRHDHGSQFMSRHYQQELRFLGIKSSPSFVRTPEGNGVAERLMRTIKEQVLWIETYRTAEDVRQALRDFRARYNESWIIARHGYLSPAGARRRHEERALMVG